MSSFFKNVRGEIANIILFKIKENKVQKSRNIISFDYEKKCYLNMKKYYISCIKLIKCHKNPSFKTGMPDSCTI